MIVSSKQTPPPGKNNVPTAKPRQALYGNTRARRCQPGGLPGCALQGRSLLSRRDGFSPALLSLFPRVPTTEQFLPSLVQARNAVETRKQHASNGRKSQPLSQSHWVALTDLPGRRYLSPGTRNPTFQVWAKCKRCSSALNSAMSLLLSPTESWAGVRTTCAGRRSGLLPHTPARASAGVR